MTKEFILYPINLKIQDSYNPISNTNPCKDPITYAIRFHLINMTYNHYKQESFLIYQVIKYDMNTHANSFIPYKTNFTAIGTYWLFCQLLTQEMFMHLNFLIQEANNNPWNLLAILPISN